MLQRGRYVVGIASLCSIRLESRYVRKDTPEVEILGHIHLLEHTHESIFFGDSFYTVVVANWKDFGAFTMVHVVSAQQSDNGPLRDEDHVPSCGESDEALNHRQ